MKIQEIRDIVRILKEYEDSSRSLAGWENFGDKKTNFAKFHALILDSSFRTDKEVAERIYGKAYSPTKYKTLKTYYISRVIDKIPFLDIATSDFSEHPKAIFKSQKLFFYIRTLLFLGSRAGATHFAKRLLKLAQKFEFYSITVSLLDEFRRYSMQIGNEKEYAKYLKLSIRQTELLMSESKMKALEEQVFIHFPNSLFVDEKFKYDVRVSLRKAKLILNGNETYFNRLSYYRLEYISHQIADNPLKSIDSCNEGLLYMSTKPHMTPSSRMAEFGLYKLENYILLRDYVNGKEAAAYCEEHIHRGMNLWFSFKQYEFLLMMQTMSFVEANKIYQEVKSHERFNSLSKVLYERWQIFGMYIQYVMRSQSQETTSAIDKAPIKRSYLMRNKEFKDHITNFPTYRKDKRGFNVAMLILNVLVALEENDKDLLLRQEEALSSYRFKYLNEKHCRQSFILFKLIRLVTKNDFDLTRIKKKTSLFEKDLGTHKLEAGEIFECIQILPPLWVWNRIKAILGSRK
jgi:hypothetical protein